MDAIVEEALRHLRGELGMMAGAPAMTLALFGLAFLLAWFVLGKMHETRHAAGASTVASKDAHIGFLEGQLAEYKSKLSGATPAEAAAQIAELRDEVRVSRAEVKALLEWADYQSSDRRLSADQIKIMAEHLKKLPAEALGQIVVTSINQPEPQQYALDIHSAFESAGLNVKFEPMTIMQITSPDEVGVLLIVGDDKNPRHSALTFWRHSKRLGSKPIMTSATRPGKVAR